MSTAAIIHPDFFWPGLLPSDINFLILRRHAANDDATVSERVRSIHPGPKVVVVNDITPELIERFKAVKKVANVLDFRPTSIELQIAEKSSDITKGLMMWRNNQSYENPCGIATCVTIPLYLLEVIHALSNYAQFETSYKILRKMSARFEEYIDVDFEIQNARPISKGLIEKTLRDEMGFELPPRTISTELVRHFLEHFPFEAASAAFDNNEVDFSECIGTILQAIGRFEAGTEPEPEPEPEGVFTFPELPYELREFLHTSVQNGRKLYVSTENAASQTVLQLKEYAPAHVHIRSDAVDVIVVEAGCVEIQHTILGHFLGDPKKLSNGGLVFFKNPCPETERILMSFEEREPKGSLFFRLFEAYLRFERVVRTPQGLLVVAKTD
jgi:hypothetical protein